MEMVLSIIAIFVSILAFGFSIISAINQRKLIALTASNTKLVDVESRLGDMPSLFKFHGYDDIEKELKHYEISSQEFSYLLASFTLGGTYYRGAPNPGFLLEKDSYRYKMCSSPATRKAWPLLREFLANSKYRDELDKIFDNLDNNEAK